MASRTYRACVLCLRTGIGGRTTRRRTSTTAHPQSQVDFLKGKLHRKHPGVTNLNALRLPDELQMAAHSIIQAAGGQIPRLPERTLSLVNFLWSRKRAAEDASLRRQAVRLEKELWAKELEKGGEMDEEFLDDRIKRKVFAELKKSTYHWTPMKYDEELGIIYMAARLAGGYAAVRRALNEIKKRDASFAPQSLLDFGSGLGTVAWASHSFWADSLKELVCVDGSGPMNILAERLLTGDDKNAPPHIKHVYFRQFLPVSPKLQFDLVVAAFTLSELPNAKEREEAVFTLWRKTNSYLVLVENGTKDGHQILMEARNTLLNKREQTIHDTRAPSVFAPCAHEQECPKLSQKAVVPCNFLQRYQPLPLPGHHECKTEKFSFLILTRGAPDEADDVSWARLIAPVQRRTRHVHCRLCCPDGTLQHVVVTARKHGRDVYRCARNSDWGDRLPIIENVEEEEDEDVPSDSEP